MTLQTFIPTCKVSNEAFLYKAINIEELQTSIAQFLEKDAFCCPGAQHQKASRVEEYYPSQS